MMGSLGHDGNRAELTKMVIERESRPNAKVVHDNLARAIGKAPIFVGVTLKDVQRFFKLGWSNEVDGAQAANPKCIRQP